MSLKAVACIADLRERAHRAVPRDFMDYYESGSYSETTLKSNLADLAAINIRQRVLAGAANRDLTQTLLGEKLSLPLALAPIGMTGMAHRDGEIAAARAAEKAGIPYTTLFRSLTSR